MEVGCRSLLVPRVATGHRRSGWRIAMATGRVCGRRAGEIELQIPKIRRDSYFPSLLEPRRRNRAIARLGGARRVRAGVSTRKVDQLVGSLGLRISKSEVSRIGQASTSRSTHFAQRSHAGHRIGSRREEPDNREEKDEVTALPGTTEHLRDRLLEAGVRVGDDKLNAREAALHERAGEAAPQGLRLGLADVKPDHLAIAGFVHRVGEHQAFAHDTATVAHLFHLGVGHRYG